ncbi:SETMR methyltransferase, partial [Acromyrmex insinuator]
WKKNEFRAVIKYLHKGLTPKEIKAELNNIRSISVLAFATVYNWVNEFKRGCHLHALRSGRPIEVATPEIIDKVRYCATGISHGTVISILHEQLGMKKLSARWVPRLLTVDHKRNRVTISKQCLKMFQRNVPDKFLRRFITVDETWIHYFISETKEQSKQWISPSEPAPKKAKTVNNILKKKCPHLAKKKVLFHKDNAWVHMCPAPLGKFNELLPHPAYSPDLTPCD